jgi:hypothetical protein
VEDLSLADLSLSQSDVILKRICEMFGHFDPEVVQFSYEDSGFDRKLKFYLIGNMFSISSQLFPGNATIDVLLEMDFQGQFSEEIFDVADAFAEINHDFNTELKIWQQQHGDMSAEEEARRLDEVFGPGKL